MKIAITGANGFVGSNAVKFFSKFNKIIAFNRQKEEKKGNVYYIKWDIREKLNYFYDFDVFIHCASDTGYEKNFEEMNKNNVLSNKNVLELVNNSNCRHFIYISSSSVYQGISGIIDENICINQEDLKNSYSLSKYLAEIFIINNLEKKIKLTILRPRAIYGPGDRLLEPNILKYKIFNKLILLGNGKNKTSLTSIENFISSINLVINKQKNQFEIYNVSDKKVKTMEEIYKEISKKYNKSGIIKIPIFILKIFLFLNKNKIFYIIDNFDKDKILDITKITLLKCG